MLDDLPVSLTPIQRRMFTVLRDRHFHTRQELHACLDDELAALTSIQFHISRLRANLRHHGFTISCKIMEGCTYYCLDTYSNGQEKPKPYQYKFTFLEWLAKLSLDPTPREPGLYSQGQLMERLLANVAGRVRRAIRDGREYLVAPLSLIVPGVLNGSKGALYYPPEEVADDPQKWDGMPLTLRHPFDELGRPVSARHPGVAARQYIGFIKNASANGKLRADGWFDIERLQALDSRILNSLLKGQPLELSTGLYTDNEPASGTDHKGRPYEYIARNYRPDHVAVLPDEVGACSIKDGCGVLVNHDKHPMDLTVNPSWVEDEDIWEKAKEAADKGDYDGDSYYAVVQKSTKRWGAPWGIIHTIVTQRRNNLSVKGIQRPVSTVVVLQESTPRRVCVSTVGGKIPRSIKVIPSRTSELFSTVSPSFWGLVRIKTLKSLRKLIRPLRRRVWGKVTGLSASVPTTLRP